MAEIDSEAKPWKSSLLTIFLSVAVMAALLLNVLFLFVFIRSKKLRRAPNLFILNIALADLIGAIFWGMPAIVSSAEWKWKFGGAYCKFHGFIGLFCFSMNMYFLTAVAFEKFLKIWFPSRHSDAFHNYTITMLVVASLWTLSTVVSFMPLIGWGVIEYFKYQMQCVTNFVESATHLNFFFINAVCLPVISMITLYILTLVRIKYLQKRGTKKDGKVILQEKTDAPTESFAAKMRRQQEKFKYSNQKDEPIKTEQDESRDARGDESEEEAYVSDDNEIFHDYEEYQLKKREREQARRRRKIYAFRQQYLFMAITMLIVSLLYIALWMPFFIVTYTWVYDPDKVKEATYTTFTLITFFGLSFKPIAYIFNKHIRACVKQAFTRQKKNDTKKHLVPDYMATKYQSNEPTGKTPPPSAPSGEGGRPRSREVESHDLTLDEYGDEVEL